MCNCQHLNTIICQTEGTQVCLDCAYVLTENLSYNEVYANNESNQPMFHDPEQIICSEVKKFIYDTCHRLHVYNIIIPIVAKKFVKLENGNKKFENNLLATYCIYSVLKQENCPRSMKTLSYHTGFSTKLIWSVERYFEERNKPLTPQDILTTYYTYLDFEYSDLLEMIKMLESITDEKDFAPLSIAGGTIYLYSKQNNKKHNVKTIAGLIHTSTMSIYRYVNSIKRKK